MATNSLNFKLIFLIIFLSTFLFKNAFSTDNYIVAIVNKLPITKVDVINRAKLLSVSIDNEVNFENLENFYNQSLKILINEKIIFSAGNKINENLSSLVSQKATASLLMEFGNSRSKLDQFTKKISVPKSALLDKYKAQIIWGIVIRDKYKVQFSKIEKNIKRTIEDNKKKKVEDLYDLAEIVIYKKNNNKILHRINAALRDGASFLDIAKRISISNSSKFNGKIGWFNFQKLPEFIKSRDTIINEGDIFSFPEKDKIKIIKILAKRVMGKVSKNEDIILLAQVKFPINFQKQNTVYEKIKVNLDNLLSNSKDCEILRNIDNQKNKNLELTIIKSRIADLSPKIINIIKNTDILKTSKPIFYGNNGYAYIKCDRKKAKLEKIDYKKLKKKTINKYFLIYSEKLLKRLNNEAKIIIIKKIK